MKKIIVALSALGVVQISLAQETVGTQYIEDLYQVNTDAGNLPGTARYKGLSGAMGALGGDLSATYKNPASAAVYLSSEGAITLGLHSTKTEVSGKGENSSDSQVAQAGAVLVFRDMDAENWKAVSLGMNYQEQNYVDDKISFNPQFKSISGKRDITNIYADKFGSSSITNFTVSANYKNKLYLGGGLNIHSFNSQSAEELEIYESDFKSSTIYAKDLSPKKRRGEGISLGLGVIGRVGNQLRLGLAYQSPTVYKDVEEVVALRAMYSKKDTNGEFYYSDFEYKNFLNDLTSAQKFTGSAAYIFGKSGLLSADYTYTDFSTAEFAPLVDFKNENGFIKNHMKGTSAVSVGAEAVLQDFRLRGGIRYQQSPFDEIKLSDINESYKPFGDLKGFSLGLGYQMNGFYIDAAYDMYSRDRNYLLSGIYYDSKGTAPKDLYDESQALDALSFKAEEVGLSHSIKNVKEIQGNVSLTVGLRF